MLKESVFFRLLAGSRLAGWMIVQGERSGKGRQPAANLAAGSFVVQKLWREDYRYIWYGSLFYRLLRTVLGLIARVLGWVGRQLKIGVDNSGGKRLLDYYLSTAEVAYSKMVIDFLLAFVLVNIVIRLYLHAYSIASLAVLAGVAVALFLGRSFYRELQAAVRDSRVVGLVSFIFTLSEQER